MRLNKLPLIIAALVITACSSGTEPENEQLAGNWKWVRSSGSIAGVTHTPASLQYNVRLAFEGGTVHAFRNDSVKTTAIFSVTGEKVTYQPAINVFTFGTIEQSTLHRISADTVVLADPCCDRYSHVFARVN